MNALAMDHQVEYTNQSTPIQSIYLQLMLLEEQREKVITTIEKR